MILPTHRVIIIRVLIIYKMIRLVKMSRIITIICYVCNEVEVLVRANRAWIRANQLLSAIRVARVVIRTDLSPC